MKVKVAVVTVQGKAYFLIVNELQKRNIPFFSLIPGESIPVEVKITITTEKESFLINHDHVLVYNVETNPERLGNEVVKILRGKEIYENIVIGVDPGKDFGIAIIADGLVIDTDNCFSIKEVSDKIRNALRTIDVSSSLVTVKIGSGVPIYKELLEQLDVSLPPEVVLEVVGEGGTSRNIRIGRRRGIRDIVSAIRIAGRIGNIYHRGKDDGQNY